MGKKLQKGVQTAGNVDKLAQRSSLKNVIKLCDYYMSFHMLNSWVNISLLIKVQGQIKKGTGFMGQNISLGGHQLAKS